MSTSSLRSITHRFVGETLFFSIVTTVLGECLFANSRIGLCSVAIGTNRKQLLAALALQFPMVTLIQDDLKLAVDKTKIEKFIQKPYIPIDLPLDIRGTPFQTKVWQVLQDIPIGETRTYRQIAETINKPTAFRAVASACAVNRLAMIIPCHRVVRRDGSLGGYRWGIQTKQLLLQREQFYRFNNSLKKSKNSEFN